MAVFRVQRTRDYTVMSNYHLRDQGLTLKAKGLLSMMLSLPDEWNYTTRGLAAICKEGVDAIGSALKELENTGYIVRHQLRGANGRISDTEYIIYEQPHKAETPDTDSPDTENPDMVSPDMDTPYLEKPAEINIEELNTQKSITDGSNTDSIPFRGHAAGSPPEPKRREATPMSEMESYRELILENIEYDLLRQEAGPYADDLDEIVEIMVETVCARRKFTRVAGSELASVDELAVLDGSKCILQLRGVRPFLSDKYDITKHPNYKYLSDFDKKNAFNIERFLSTKLKPKPGERFEAFDITLPDGEAAPA